jgi:hypothetical protein
MKKIIVSLLLCMPSLVQAESCAPTEKSRFSTAFTAGYVFKSDCRFNQVYGSGMVNAITADGCYYPWEMLGVGAKVSYWRARGKTTSLKRHTLLQEVPFTVYLRALKELECDLQLYVSLGGGALWIKEKSYFGHVKKTKGIGEVELGANYPVHECCMLTSAFRYLFPKEKLNGAHHVQVGGYDLRAGVAFTF